MLLSLQKSILLLFFAVVICCGIYPLALWTVGQTFFPFEANGSMLHDDDGNLVGSLLIAQPFTQDDYFHSRPSAASYDASASASSSLAASNALLRTRVANSLVPILKYRNGAQAGQLIAPDIEHWLELVGRKATPHHAVFDRWREEHPDVALQDVPADMVTTSASGLDPHITLQNALYQLDRVASKWASHLKRNQTDVQREIEQILDQRASAPFAGLAGEKLINVLEVNLALHKRYSTS